MPAIGALALVLVGQTGAVQVGPVADYSVGSWPAGQRGNHRALVRVEAKR